MKPGTPLMRIIVLLLVISCMSCIEQPEVELVKRDLNLIDSLYALHRDSLTALSDSICAQDRERLYQHLVDSMLLRQREDIQHILER